MQPAAGSWSRRHQFDPRVIRPAFMSGFLIRDTQVLLLVGTGLNDFARIPICTGVPLKEHLLKLMLTNFVT